MVPVGLLDVVLRLESNLRREDGEVHLLLRGQPSGKTVMMLMMMMMMMVVRQ